ncbi:unnamed protein product, partial [Cercopithifilaria johnstoni]
MRWCPSSASFEVLRVQVFDRICEDEGELEHFSAILKNAGGLYASASELVKYCLPHRTLKELIETLWCAKLHFNKRQKIRKQVHDIMQLVSTNTASAIMIYAMEK